MPDIRCMACGRKLAEGIYTVLAIKCPKCKSLNHLSVTNAQSEHRECPERGHNRDFIPGTKLKSV